MFLWATLSQFEQVWGLLEIWSSAVNVKISILWNVTPCSLIYGYQILIPWIQMQNSDPGTYAYSYPPIGHHITKHGSLMACLYLEGIRSKNVLRNAQLWTQECIYSILIMAGGQVWTYDRRKSESRDVARHTTPQTRVQYGAVWRQVPQLLRLQSLVPHFVDGRYNSTVSELTALETHLILSQLLLLSCLLLSKRRLQNGALYDVVQYWTEEFIALKMLNSFMVLAKCKILSQP